MSRRTIERDLGSLVRIFGMPAVVHGLVEVCYQHITNSMDDSRHHMPDPEAWGRVLALQRVAEQLTNLEGVLRWGPR